MPVAALPLWVLGVRRKMYLRATETCPKVRSFYLEYTVGESQLHSDPCIKCERVPEGEVWHCQYSQVACYLRTKKVPIKTRRGVELGSIARLLNTWTVPSRKMRMV